MTSSVLLLGRNALARQVRRFLSAHGDDVTHYDGEQDVFTNNELPFDIVMDVMANPEDKLKLLSDMRPNLPPHTLWFTSSVGACATEIAAKLGLYAVVGFQPWMMQSNKIMELARPLQLQEDHIWGLACEFWRDRNKEVEAVDDTPGLVFPRILAMLVNEAAYAYTEGIASAEDIDKAMQYGTNYPKGPLAWADEIGIDEIVAVLSGLHRQLGDDRYRPALYLQKLVYAGWTGKAVGRGFYRYEGNQVTPV